MTRCCTRRPEDGVLDRENVDRGVRGHNPPGGLSPTELAIVIAKLDRGGMGLNAIAAHLSYSRSQVAEILQRVRQRV